MLSLKPSHLGRYKDIALLLIKYGREDLVRDSGLSNQLDLDSSSVKSCDGKPQDLASDLESMGPAFIKLGQLLSTRPDFLPPEYLEALGRLQDDAKPIPTDTVREIVGQELGGRLSAIFPDFEDTPLATASLGQVHLATLRDGRRVAVKVQRPNIQSSLGADVAALEELCVFLENHTQFGKRYQLTKIVASLKKSLAKELDYRAEAQNAILLRSNLANFTRIVIPEPIVDFSSANVLTMEYVPGTKITDVSPVVLVELDRDSMAGELFRAYLHQVLIDGVFHADPHPGNIVLTENHKFGLMDFGMVVQVSDENKGRLIKLLLAIAEGNGGDAASVAVEIGEMSDEFDENAFRSKIAEIVTENRHNTMEGMSTGRVIQQIQVAAGDTGLVLPHELVMLGKTLMNLDQVIVALAPEFNPTRALKREATDIMQRHTKDRISLASVYQSFLETTELAQELPRRANKITQRLADGDFRLDINAVDENKLMRGFEKIANRITSGLVIAALIVGASLIMNIESSITLFGYPALALLLFVVAAAFGLVLVARATWGD